MCACENLKYLENYSDDLVLTCDETLIETKSSIKVKGKTNYCFICNLLLPVMCLVILMVAGCYFLYKKTIKKQMFVNLLIQE